jgi:hypothetical protein
LGRRKVLLSAFGILLLAGSSARAQEPRAIDPGRAQPPGRDPAARLRFIIQRTTLLDDVVPAKDVAHAKAAAKPRFIDRGEVIEDRETGLLWQKDGAASGKKNFFEAADYAKTLQLGGLSGWRVPTAAEFDTVFPADREPFLNSAYTKEQCCEGPAEFRSYWTSELDPRQDDYAYVYQWYAKGGKNNCFASKNYVYVRCVRGSAAAGELVAPALPAELDEAALARAKELIGQLGDEDFARREQAAAELRKLGSAVRPLLRESLEKSNDAEIRFRLKELIGGK